MTRGTSLRLQICAALALAFLFAVPHALHTLRHPGEGKIIMMHSTDDGQYHAKVRAALLRRWSEARNGMTGGDPPDSGAAPALLELAAGAAFSWTNLKAPQVLTLLNVFVTPLIVFLLTAFLRAIGFRESVALGGSLLYILLFLSPLQKPVHMSLSLPFTILVLLAIARAWRAPQWGRVLLAGALLGLSIGTYFWAWTYLFALTGWLIVLTGLASLPHERWQRMRIPLYIMGLALLVAAPLLIGIFHTASLGSVFQETSARSTIIHSRGTESLPRSILLTLLTAVTAILALPLRRGAEGRSALFPLAAIFAAETVMHQNLLHGVLFTFSSHYYPFVVLSVLLAGLFALENGRGVFLKPLAVGITVIFILARLWDGRSALAIAAANYYVRDLDHLMPALRLLDDGKREGILTDRTTAHAVTGWTDDDVVFTAYTRHVLMSDEEYVERYCLSELPHPTGPDILWLADEVVERNTPGELHARIAQFSSLCERVRAGPRMMLRKYAVAKLLWNERLRPDWVIDPHLFQKIAQGEGWSLWRATVDH